MAFLFVIPLFFHLAYYYPRPDVFGLRMDARKQTSVRLGEECKSDARDE
jgi:hypothetical protein